MKSSSLKAFFQSERDHCNHLVASARHQYPKFNLEDFHWFLSNCLDSVMLRFDKQSNDVAFPVAESGFRYGLELVCLKWLKSEDKKTLISLAWKGLFPLLHSLLEKNPNEIFSGTSNVFSHLDTLGGDKPHSWLHLMTSISTNIDTLDQFKAAGVVCAWMSGLAHYRDVATSNINALPKKAIRILFKLSETQNTTQVVTQIKNDPWFCPHPHTHPTPQLTTLHEFTLQHRIGKCQLLGGEFKEPPKVFAENKRIYVLSSEKWWQLHADIYGATLIPCDGSDIDDTPISSITKIATLHALLKDIRRASSIALADTTLAVTSADTFGIFIVSVDTDISNMRS